MMTQLAPTSRLGIAPVPTSRDHERQHNGDALNGVDSEANVIDGIHVEGIGLQATQLRGITEYQDISRLKDAARAASSHDCLLVLTSLEQQLSDLRRENDVLRASNQELAGALAEASQRGSEARRLAHHDALTGLPNRRLLMELLQRELETATQNHHQLALLFIDLNNFKAVNDRRGHAVGDKLLTAVAARITSCIRTEDIACRYGGDEFVVLLSNLNNPAIAADIGEKICEHIGRRYSIDGEESRVTASVGLALYPANGEHSEELLSYADELMYRNKPRLARVTLAKRLSNLRKLLQRPLVASERVS
jgi:diguanylate cyclase (GGDEF)-like protein